MTQWQLDCLVSRVIGESLREVRRRSFDLADRLNASYDPEPSDRLPQMVDWDQLDAERRGLFP